MTQLEMLFGKDESAQRSFVNQLKGANSPNSLNLTIAKLLVEGYAKMDRAYEAAEQMGKDLIMIQPEPSFRLAIAHSLDELASSARFLEEHFLDLVNKNLEKKVPRSEIFTNQEWTKVFKEGFTQVAMAFLFIEEPDVKFQESINTGSQDTKDSWNHILYNHHGEKVTLEKIARAYIDWLPILEQN